MKFKTFKERHQEEEARKKKTQPEARIKNFRGFVNAQKGNKIDLDAIKDMADDDKFNEKWR